MKRVNYLTFLIFLCIFSYFMMINTSMTAIAEDNQNYYKFSQDKIIKSIIHDYRDSFIREKELIRYTEELTGLDYEHCRFLIKESKEKYIDPFIYWV